MDIFEAVKKGNVTEIIELYKINKQYVNLRDAEGKTPLHWAAIRGYKKIIELLVLDCKVNVDEKDNDGKTPLHCTVMNENKKHQKCRNSNSKAEVNEENTDRSVSLWGSIFNALTLQGEEKVEEENIDKESCLEEVIQWLIQEGKAKVDEKDKNGMTALHLAAKEGHLEAIVGLVQKGKATIDEKDNNGMTPLHLAAKEGQLEAIKLLVRQGKAKIDEKAHNGMTPLHLAVEGGHLEVVQCLVKEVRAKVDEKDKNGQTPLHIASARGNTEIVKWLVQEGKANVGEKDEDNRTPLHLAADGGHLETFQWLVQIGEAKVNEEDKNYETPTPLRVAIIRGHIKIVMWVISLDNSKVDEKDIHGMTLLHLAAEVGHLEVVRCLVQEGKASVTEKDTIGQTPLYMACKMLNLEVIKFLVLEGKAKVDEKDKYGNTVLHTISMRFAVRIMSSYLYSLYNVIGNRAVKTEVVQWLVREGKAKIDEKDNNGMTLLHHAAKNGDLPVVQWLVQEGKAKVDEKDNKGRTPLHVAIKGEADPRITLRTVAWLVMQRRQAIDKSYVTHAIGPIQLWLNLYLLLEPQNFNRVQLQRNIQAIADYKETDSIDLKVVTSELLLSPASQQIMTQKSPHVFNRCVELIAPWFIEFNKIDKSRIMIGVVKTGCSLFIRQISLQLRNLHISKVVGFSIGESQADIISLMMGANPTIKSLTFHRVHFTEVGFWQSTAALKFVGSTLEELTLSYCDIGGDKRVTILQENLIHLPHLQRLDLTGNRLVYNDVKSLLRYLSTASNSNRSLRVLSVCHNFIEGTLVDILYKDLPELILRSSLQALELTGNAFFSSTRDKDLIWLLTKLLLKSQLSIEAFLLTQFIGLEKKGDDHYCLRVKKKDGQILELMLTNPEQIVFNRIKRNSRLLSDSDVWSYLTKDIALRLNEIEDVLLKKQLSDEPTHQAQKVVVKRLVDYHTQAPLKSYLNTYSFYRSPRAHEINSLFFPELKLTHDNWVVYLMAKKLGSEHAILGYEGLTGYGQRFIRFAHLIVETGSLFDFRQKPIIESYHVNIAQVSKLAEKYSIASFPASRKQVKEMHKAVEDDKKNLSNIRYSFLITGSSASKEKEDEKIQNCLKWAVDKIREHLKKEIKIGIYRPRQVVNDLINRSNSILTITNK